MLPNFTAFPSQRNPAPGRIRLLVLLLALLPTLLAIVLAPKPARAQGSPDEQLAAASALFDAKKYSESAQKLESFLSANPKHAKVPAAALLLGHCFMELKQFPKAIPAYEKALTGKDASLTTAAELGLAEAAMNARDFPKAAAALEAAVKLQLKPEQGAVAWFWLGQAEEELQHPANAEGAYLHVPRDFPKSDLSGSAYYGAGVMALKQNKTDAARERLKTVVDRYQRCEERPQAMLLLAQIDLQAKRYPDARREYEALLREPAAKSGDSDLRRNSEDGLIECLLQLQDFGAATSRLEALLGRLPGNDPERFRAELSLGHCHYRQKQYDPALHAYQEAARSNDEAVAAEAEYWAGNAALGLNREADAAGHFQALANRFPKNDLAPKAALKAGDAFLAAKQNDPAAAAYRLVLEKYPESPAAEDARKALADLVDSITDPAQLAAALKRTPPAQRARGSLRLVRLYLDGKKYGDAQSTLTDLLRENAIEPELRAEARYLLGFLYDAQQKPGPALDAFAEAVKLAPTAAWAADAHSRLAWLYLDKKQPAVAERSAEAALAAKPSADVERQARLAMVQAQLDQQKWDAAIEGCRKLTETNLPPDAAATVLYMQAWATGKRDKAEAALPLWEKLANDYSHSDYAAEALVHVGDARFEAEKYDEARQRYARVVTDFPKSPLVAEARYKLGSSLYNAGKYPEAATEWDRLANDPTARDYIPEGLYWSGLAYDKADKKDEAIQRLSKLVSQFPTNKHVANAKIRLAALKAVSGK